MDVPNRTRENVEVCHVEEVDDEGYTNMKVELVRFLKWIRKETPAETEHEALNEILEFLRRTEQRTHRSQAGRLHPHFFFGGGGETLTDFISELARHSLDGSYLEVLSPFFDKGGDCKPLKDLVERFAPREVRVLLPRGRLGEGLCQRGHGFCERVARLGPGALASDLRDGSLSSQHSVQRFHRDNSPSSTLVHKCSMHRSFEPCTCALESSQLLPGLK